jgi:hypothetical protein
MESLLNLEMSHFYFTAALANPQRSWKSANPLTQFEKKINPNPHCFIAITKATACG